MSIFYLPSITLYSSPPFLTHQTPPLPSKPLSLVCHAKKPRAVKRMKVSKPNMSDAELCGELREFMTEEGFAEDHVPSTAELAKRGRKDLANIVRRKGYKVVAGILKGQRKQEVKSNFNLSESHDPVYGSHGLCSEVQNGKHTALQESSLSSSSLRVNHVCNKNGAMSFSPVPQKGESSQTALEISNEDLVTSKMTEVVDSVENHLEGEDQVRSSEFSDVTHESNGVESGSFLLQSNVSFPSDESSARVGASGKSLSATESNIDVISEVRKLDKETEISRLKTMLHDKDMELSLLKQEIEKERLTLLELQNRTQEEISKMNSAISAKDEELRAAEESLLGLKEVRIEYCGLGKNAEITGSFNGWHHRIKMDPLPMSSTTNFEGNSDMSSWMVTLWLYPGLYEIKFVVDGDWRNDPKRELISRGHVTNNILRVQK